MSSFLYACAVLVAIVGSFIIVTVILPQGLFTVRRPEIRQRYSDVPLGDVPQDWRTHATIPLKPTEVPETRVEPPEVSVALMVTGLEGTDWRIMRASVMNLVAAGYLQLLPGSVEGYQLGGYTVVGGEREPEEGELTVADAALIKQILSPGISDRRAGEATAAMQKFEKYYMRLAVRERYQHPYFPGAKRRNAFIVGAIVAVLGGIGAFSLVEPAAMEHSTALAFAATGISVVTSLILRWLYVYVSSLRPTAYLEALAAQVAAYRDYASKYPADVVDSDAAAGWWFFYTLRVDEVDAGDSVVWKAAVEEARQDSLTWTERYKG